MLDDHAHVMQVKLCKANTRGVTTSSMILLMHSWDLLMHMHAIGATEEITLVELDVDP